MHDKIFELKWFGSRKKTRKFSNDQSENERKEKEKKVDCHEKRQ